MFEPTMRSFSDRALRGIRGAAGGCIAMLILASAGCSPAGSFKVTSVPSDKSLEESVLQRAGAFVSDRIAIIDISGVLMNGRINGLFSEGEHPVSLTVEQLNKAAHDRRVKAIVLRINSPGGSVTASDMLHHEITEFRKRTGKPVVAYFQDVAASGAYFLACASDEIMAQRTTVTGSIGVIMMMVNMQGTLDYIGVRTDAITSGAYKDAGSPFRTMKSEERKLFQQMVDNFYNQFVDAVDAGRPSLSRDQVLTLADGRVYTASQALDNGLIDQIGTYDDAIRVACTRAGIEKANVVRYHRPMAWVPNAYAENPVNSPAASTINLLNIDISSLWTKHPRFMYIWCMQ
ncbi:MAG: signal peptide peptidase SppA [Phycisphaerales bacterium]|nr:signal peptide peptidase SppA [Phycisphaerales bacterium]MCB9856582.1 signal peptide peptidase SppA [Phycisphaerales bacterium]